MAKSETTPNPASTFQGLIFALQQYWSEKGCVILQPYDMEVGAGTFHPATFLRAIGPEPWLRLMFSPAAALQMAVMVKIRIVYSTITSFR